MTKKAKNFGQIEDRKEFRQRAEIELANSAILGRRSSNRTNASISSQRQMRLNELKLQFQLSVAQKSYCSNHRKRMYRKQSHNVSFLLVYGS